ncbi:hypothetical protein LR48_Vigan03g027200 [Vigna angularis]|uniref:Protein kinase domain-containing protein n=1 Tax=Phaseolus angularis TaxID=3914 RepID=A0A0L9U288_PHAAN|nr:hypothetical protein LR48_Vigan03g027200 [Vigna angularis]
MTDYVVLFWPRFLKKKCSSEIVVEFQLVWNVYRRKLEMTTAIAIEDVRRGDQDNVYIVMELCEGGELLDMILSRGGKYSEDDAKAVVVQILNVVTFCHLQGVVHRDRKPENFLYTKKDESSELKAIDFGLSDFVRPDERLDDIVGSAYYVAPEVLHRSYSTEADVWSIGVIAYILLCGSCPFWARTESGIFRAALSKTLTADELYYLREQFSLPEPSKNGSISSENVNKALMKYATYAMKESRIPDFLSLLNSLQYKRMDFEEFCAAALSVL